MRSPHPAPARETLTRVHHHVDSKLPKSVARSPEVCALGAARGIRRIIFVILAIVFLALAVIGVAVPGIPTTPFLLLTSYFSAKSSPRIHRYIKDSRLFGPILHDWDNHRGVRLRVKIQAIFLVLAGLTLLVVTSAAYPIWVISGLVLGVVGITVILRLPTI
jgi:uncharacterized protein